MTIKITITRITLEKTAIVTPTAIGKKGSTGVGFKFIKLELSEEVAILLEDEVLVEVEEIVSVLVATLLVVVVDGEALMHSTSPKKKRSKGSVFIFLKATSCCSYCFIES